MTERPDRPWVRRSRVVLRPDPARVITRIFLPGQEMAFQGESRSGAVVDRVLALSDDEVEETLGTTLGMFQGRHRDVIGTWEANARLLDHRLADVGELSVSRRLLIGAYFTQEYAIEGAALFNPSMVPHLDQEGVPAGSTRFLMTLRAVGEGHLSSVEFRTGVIDATGSVSLDPPPEVAVLAAPLPPTYSRAAFERQLREAGGERENADFVLAALPPEFDRAQLDAALAELRNQRLTRGRAARTIERYERIAANSYVVRFPETSDVQERVLIPRAPAEANGMEDVRLVRFCDGDGALEYLGTYTAYDGRAVTSQLLRTVDFRTFASLQLSGEGSKNKGLALFPRQVGGRYLALSRADRESNGVTTSTDLRHWERRVLIQRPAESWEIVQLGNCGPPLETEAGWLALTHGVGPMRQYAIGALLLDLDDPTEVIGRLREPLLTPTADERSGYVPNVVYSCGGMLHGRRFVLPYGCSDSQVRFAVVDLDALLAEMAPPGATR